MINRRNIALWVVMTALTACVSRVHYDANTVSSKTNSVSDESPCRTDGCVFQKNAKFQAMWNWLTSNDDCIPAVSWVHSITKQDVVVGGSEVSQFKVVCGSPKHWETILLQVDVPNPDASIDPSKMIVTKVGSASTPDSAKIPSESTCHTDGCVFQKNSKLQEVINWLNSNDDCIPAVSWVHSITKQDVVVRGREVSQFKVVCGSPKSWETILLQVEPPNPEGSSDPNKSNVVRVK